MSRPTMRTEQLDMETVGLVKGLCAEFGILRSVYYEYSNIGAPGEGALSYMGFLAAMNGGVVTPEQEARIARSVPQVRAALRKAGREPQVEALPAQLQAALDAYEEDPDIFARGDLSTLRRILRLAVARIGLTTRERHIVERKERQLRRKTKELREQINKIRTKGRKPSRGKAL